MKPTDPKTRRPKTPALAAEALETRQMMTGGVGDTFAILPATIKKAGGTATVEFNLDPKLFTNTGKKPFVLGIDVAPNSNSTANPSVTSVTSNTGKKLAVAHSTFDPSVKRTGVQSDSKVSSAALVTIPGLPKATDKSTTYKVTVTGLGKSSGDILVGVYLPGDAAGTGVVNQASVNATQYALNANANDTTGKYSFDADANRDGRIDKKDVALVKQNIGVGTTVSPVISADLGQTGVTDATNRIVNIPLVNVTGAATPGASVTFSATGMPTQTVTADPTTGAYTVPLALNVGTNSYSVTSTDAFKQTIDGTIAAIKYDPTSTVAAVTAAKAAAQANSLNSSTSTS